MRSLVVIAPVDDSFHLRGGVERRPDDPCSSSSTPHHELLPIATRRREHWSLNKSNGVNKMANTIYLNKKLVRLCGRQHIQNIQKPQLYINPKIKNTFGTLHC